MGICCAKTPSATVTEPGGAAAASGWDTGNPVVEQGDSSEDDIAAFARNSELIITSDEHPLMCQTTQPAIRLHGFLEKRGALVRSWKKRFFLLGGGWIKYFDREVPPTASTLESFGESEGLKGQCELAGGAVQGHASSGDLKFVLKVTGGDKSTLVIDCANSVVHDQWLEAVKLEIQLANERAQEEENSSTGVRLWYSAREKSAKAALELLSSGATFQKHFFRLGFAKKHLRHVSLSADGSTLSWKSVNGKASDKDESPSMPFIECCSVHVGCVTPVLQGAKDTDAALCFSVWSASRTLDLEADTTELRDAWVSALRDAMYFAHLEAHRNQAREAKKRSREPKAARRRLSQAIKTAGSNREQV